jgi:hypothetical protein
MGGEGSKYTDEKVVKKHCEIEENRVGSPGFDDSLGCDSLLTKRARLEKGHV